MWFEATRFALCTINRDLFLNTAGLNLLCITRDTKFKSSTKKKQNQTGDQASASSSAGGGGVADAEDEADGPPPFLRLCLPNADPDAS